MSPSAYRKTDMDNVRAFMEAQYHFLTEDEFACNFRKMLILEQYRNPEIAELYQKCLVSGPVSYMEDLFREMMERGILDKNDPKHLALEFYAPFYLLLSISDLAPDKEETGKMLKVHIERFMEKNAARRIQNE